MMKNINGILMVLLVAGCFLFASIGASSAQENCTNNSINETESCVNQTICCSGTNDTITKKEMVEAINDYLLYETITKEELVRIMNRYFGVS